MAALLPPTKLLLNYSQLVKVTMISGSFETLGRFKQYFSHIRTTVG